MFHSIASLATDQSQRTPVARTAYHRAFVLCPLPSHLLFLPRVPAVLAQLTRLANRFLLPRFVVERRSLAAIVSSALALAVAHSAVMSSSVLAQPTRAPVQAREPQIPSTTYGVAGLDKPLEILIDTWGIPHIYAKSQYDAFFAQGFNAARDRLWQIDLWRRKGLGLLAEVFGPSALARDQAARLFLYRGDMYREWLAYGSDTKRVAESFVAGINAYVRRIERNPDLLPIEFRLLDYKPSLWSPDDLLRIRAHGGWGNLRSEVRRAQIGCIGGLQSDAIRRSLEPVQIPKIPDGADLCDARDEALTQYRLATSDIAFVRTTASSLTIVPVEPSDVGGDAELGSGIVIASRASSSAKPLLAIDLADRRVHALPSSRYFAHLNAPGLNAIGAIDPFLPGLAAGHNDRLAWGPIRYPIDQEDLVIAPLNAAGDAIRIDDRGDRGDRQDRGDRDEPIRIVEETIPVRGGAPVKVTLRHTRIGPVVHQDSAKAKAYVIRAGWLDTGMAPSMGSLGLMRAQTWDGFLAAMNRWGGPPAGQLYADVDGTIGWKVGGLAPLRSDLVGLLPSTHERWLGFADVDRLPVDVDPPHGWIVQAGQSPSALTVAIDATPPTATPTTAAPKKYSKAAPYPRPLEWSPRWRAERIVELLDRIEKKSAADLFAIQSDVLSVPARRIILLLKDTQTQDLKVSEAITLLRNWDFRVTPESPAAALFQLWYDRHLAPAMVGLRSPQGVNKLIDVADSTSLLALLEQPAAKNQRDTVFVGTLRQAIAEMEQRQGPNWLRWNWSGLRRTDFAHPLAPIAPAQGALSLPVLTPKQRGGGAFTVAANAYRASTLQGAGGASTRMVFDLANWDNALASSAPGQSGDPRSKHYADLIDAWSKDVAHPLLYSRGAIEKATVLRIFLNPLP